MASKLFD